MRPQALLLSNAAKQCSHASGKHCFQAKPAKQSTYERTERTYVQQLTLRENLALSNARRGVARSRRLVDGKLRPAGAARGLKSGFDA